MTSPDTTPLTRQRLLEALADGEIASELLTLCELTGDLEPALTWSSYITGASPWEHEFPSEVTVQIRERLADAILGTPVSAPDVAPSTDLITELIPHMAGTPLVAEQRPMLLKEMGLTDSDEVTWTGARPDRADRVRVLVIGAGLSGIAVARRLHRLGIDFEVVEKSDASGGTWYHNTYPGCGVDIASHYFSYSFARNPRWSRYYAKQPEILAYLRRCVAEEGIEDHFTYETEVLAATWDESSSQWVVETRTTSGDSRRIRADMVISAAGLLDRPSVPDFPGLADFQGPAFHAAQWDHSTSLEGKRVALIGTGASGNQIGPAVAEYADSLTVFQRSAHWNVGVDNYALDVTAGEQWLMANVPAYERWFRARTLLSQNDTMRPAQVVDRAWSAEDGSISAENSRMREVLTRYIVEELGDRQDLLPKVLPDYPPFSKRMLRDNGWYRMLRRPNVDLVCTRELSFDEGAIIDEHGARHPVDVVVFATGFEASKMLASYSVYGRDGVSIREVWGDDDPRAYLGIAVPRFPNFFVMYGPNTNIGTGGSIIFQAETWSRYIVDLIRIMVERDIATAEVTDEACEAYNERLDARLGEMVWSVSPAATWYRNQHGRVTTNMPWTTYEYWQMTQQVDLADFALSEAGAPNPPANETALAG